MVDFKSVDEITANFKFWQNNGENVMVDGILDLEKYNSSHIKVMWILKQAIDYGKYDDYSSFLINSKDGIKSSPTWRRIALVSAGILLSTTSFSEIQQMSHQQLCDIMLHTAIVNLVKTMGDVHTDDLTVEKGYKKYRSLVLKQISAYNPDIIVACFTGIIERLKPIVEDIYLHFSGQKFHHSFPNVCSEGADVAVAMDNNKMLLWAYHPSYTHVTDKGYFETIVKGASFLQLI